MKIGAGIHIVLGILTPKFRIPSYLLPSTFQLPVSIHPTRCVSKVGNHLPLPDFELLPCPVNPAKTPYAPPPAAAHRNPDCLEPN